MAIKARGELLTPTDVVNLTVQFYDTMGNPANTTGFPQVSLIQPSGLVALGFTSAGVSQLDVGKYLYQFSVPYNGPYGAWNDIWQGMVGGNVITNTLTFIVEDGDIPAINQDGYWHLGDDIGFNYSQNAIYNINKLLKLLKARLNNDGKAKSTDQFGNTIYVDCSIFSVDMLVTFLAGALSDFNMTPYFTRFRFDDTQFIDQFLEILVEGATLTALASQALIERGREFAITDQGISFVPPTVSELLNTQWTTQLTNYWEKLKMIKASMRPSPLGLGTMGMNSGMNPQFRKLRHLRQRQIY
jgi:hypothetical protein